MKLLGKDKTDAFKTKHAMARSQIAAWVTEVEKATWSTPHHMKARYPTADPIGSLNTVFNICGNKYRIWVQISYEHQIVNIKAVGTHEEYEKWNIK
ncbi:MAG: type II toxin-antitoxin system HigB family toxin [Patescibacteria group bacterium]